MTGIATFVLFIDETYSLHSFNGNPNYQCRHDGISFVCIAMIEQRGNLIKPISCSLHSEAPLRCLRWPTDRTAYLQPIISSYRRQSRSGPIESCWNRAGEANSNYYYPIDGMLVCRGHNYAARRRSLAHNISLVLALDYAVELFRISHD